MTTAHAEVQTMKLRRPPEELAQIMTPALLQQLLSDLTVSIHEAQTNCYHVTFTVKLSAGLLAYFKAETKYSVDVWVLAATDDHPWPDLEPLQILLSSKGASVTKTVEFTFPGEGQIRKWKIVVDPHHRFAERNEGNNIATLEVPCVT